MTPWLDDGDIQLYHGDVTATLRALPAGIAQTCITSPPYWGLRDYGTGEWTGGDEACDHVKTTQHREQPDRPRGWDGPFRHTSEPQPVAYGQECGRCGARRVDSQLGLEATPDLYVERLVAVFREVWRVLRDDGTVWLNLGDSYASTPAGNTDATFTAKQASNHGSEIRRSRSTITPGLKPKDLCGIPWRVAFALQADGWTLRSDIVWSKPNPMPESVVDRPTKAHEYLFLLSKRPRYYWDADAIREPHETSGPVERVTAGLAAHEALGEMVRTRPLGRIAGYGEGGRNRRSVWTIPTQPFAAAHFATFPEALVRPCILAGTSEHGECSSCGAPWVRVLADKQLIPAGIVNTHQPSAAVRGLSKTSHLAVPGAQKNRLPPPPETTGWRASCTCDAPTRPQIVLDPFVGSGTTALVARNHARRCIGIDLSAEYLAIAARRLQQLSLLGDFA